jgi:glycogen debranching enzyme
LNTATDYLSFLALNVRLRRVNWDPKKAKEIFWVNDVMFNVIYADNLRVMAQIAEVLGRSAHSRFFNDQAKRVEEAVLRDLWSEEDGMFYARKKDGFIEKISVSNLFPLVLENIEVGQLISLLDLLEDETFFATNYPLPSNPVGLSEHDHSYREKRIWRGPTWINMNYYIVRGLLKQARRFKDKDRDLAFRCISIAKHIAEKSYELIEKSGHREFYNPNTGEGYRVSDFGWSTLANLMPAYVERELYNFCGCIFKFLC